MFKKEKGVNHESTVGREMMTIPFRQTTVSLNRDSKVKVLYFKSVTFPPPPSHKRLSIISEEPLRRLLLNGLVGNPKTA